MNSSWPGKVGASICATCGREPMVGVFGLAGMPASAGMGEKCLAERAEPFRYLRIHIAACTASGVRDKEAYESWLGKARTYADGNYLTLREALSRYPITEEEISRQATWQAAHWRKR